MTDQDVKLPEFLHRVKYRWFPGENGQPGDYDLYPPELVSGPEYTEAFIITAEQVRAAILEDRKLCAKLPTNTIIQAAFESEGAERLRDFCAADPANRDALQNFLSALLARG